MPTKSLTELFVARVKPPAQGRVEYFDAAFPGLALRVTANGSKSWCTFYRFNGRLRRFTIGAFPAIKPAQARREAAAALDRARGGIDPAVEKRARRYARDPQADTFGVLVQDYLERYARKNTAPGTFKETKRVLESKDLAGWHNRPISDISRRDVIDVIDQIAKRAEVQANRTLSRLRALLNWAVEKDRLSSSPIMGMKPPTKERARDRALTDDELRWFWTACETIDWPFGPLAKLLLLTAQRRDEVGGMEWSELGFDQKTWTLPRNKVKNNRAHEVHLSDAAVQVLRSVPRVGNGPVFSTNGRPVSGFSQGKKRLDAAMFKAKRDELGDKAAPIPHWILHDLRRTAATGMARLNIPPHVVDKVLNHVSGTIRGVAAVYNRFEYLEERRAALETWSQYVWNLVSPADAKVIQISRRGGMISRGNRCRGNKRRGNKRTKHGASIPDPTPKPESIRAAQRVAEHDGQEHLAWPRRPRIAACELEDPPDSVLESPEEIAERAPKQNELAKKLGWEPERLARFKRLVVRYERDPTVANYLQIRRDFSEMEFEAGYFSGIDAPFKFEEKFAGQGIDPMLFVGALAAYEPDIDVLCLKLLELLITRGKLPKEGPGFIEKRRKAISDATIDYLIMEILEAIGRESSRIPASLLVLIREQLCGSNPVLHQQRLARGRFQRAAYIAGRHFQQTGEQISVRKLAAAAGVSRGTAERWLADERFRRLSTAAERLPASNQLLTNLKNCRGSAHKKRAEPRAGVPSKNT